MKGEGMQGDVASYDQIAAAAGRAADYGCPLWRQFVDRKTVRGLLGPNFVGSYKVGSGLSAGLATGVYARPSTPWHHKNPIHSASTRPKRLRSTALPNGF